MTQAPPDPDRPAAGGQCQDTDEPVSFDAVEVVAALPHRPGVYRMLDAAGNVLYVGKALDLRKRVGSYFHNRAGHSPRIRLMLTHVASIETTVTRTETEALLLENNLIKSLAPRYNILYRDDKSYPYIVLSGHAFPRLGFHRGALDRSSRHFGPFPSAGAVRESIQLLQRVFRLRTCRDTVFNNRSRPCLLHQIRRCTAPCVGLIDATAYARDVANATLFLEGKESEVLRSLEQRMHESAERFEYEEAALHRDQMQALRRVREQQFVESSGDASVDVIGAAVASGILAVNLVMIRGGRHVGDRTYFPRNAEGADPAQAIEAFLAQHYLGHTVPARIVTSAPLAVEALEALLTEQAGHAVRITCSPRGERRVWATMAEQNAHLAAEQRLGQQATQETRLRALQETLELPGPVERIECFDISHTMGEATVASCVVFQGAAMRSGEYRRYNIAATDSGDDYAAMREVLQRRYRRVAEGEGAVPDLVLIDGGKGQLGVAVDVLTELGLEDVPLVGVAKGEERKAGLEQLWLPGRAAPLLLGGGHPALHLVQQVRDEAHRFAIQGHRARRGKARNTSALEGIPGIGAKRRQRLMVRFGGLKGLLAAGVDEIAQVDGISRELAERIYRQLH